MGVAVQRHGDCGGARVTDDRIARQEARLREQGIEATTCDKCGCYLCVTRPTLVRLTVGNRIYCPSCVPKEGKG